VRIIFDLDGTITDFNCFIEKIALPYFKRKYRLDIVNLDKLEIEDILNMQPIFKKKYNCSDDEANEKKEKVLKKFWTRYFFQFLFVGRVRQGVARFINEIRKEGFDVYICSSRAVASNTDLSGVIVRSFTKMQIWCSGIKVSNKNIRFYSSDIQKINGIKKLQPSVVVDDKTIILREFHKENIPVIGIRARHNQCLWNINSINWVQSFENSGIKEALRKAIGKNKYKYFIRAKKSDKIFNKIKFLSWIINLVFRPIILHKENIILDESGGIIIAPNHRSTLDPLIITAILKRNIHYAALLRFFLEKDSIFNNSKNPILCKITAWLFKKLEYFPIDRLCDNPNANNMGAIRDMLGFLSIGERVGIFAEGTTRRKEGQEFGNFDRSFIVLAKKTNSVVCPITVLWTGCKRNKIVVNFGKAFYVEEMTEDEAMEKFMKIQREGLEENKRYMEKRDMR
jgi:1-acyl-sn-glycerol-3-phosphate acyltransferase